MITESKKLIFTASDGKIFLDRNEALRYDAEVRLRAFWAEVWQGPMDNELIEIMLSNRLALIDALGGTFTRDTFQKAG
jgi:hypothetical protein